MTESDLRIRPKIAGLVLAAGQSVRFGREKATATWRGRPLVEHAIRALQAASLREILVVVQPEASALSTLVRSCGARTVVNPDYRSGMGTSLAVGIGAIEKSADAVIVTLCDQPRVSGESLARLVARWREDPSVAVAARFDGILGAPAVFPANWFERLGSLDGETGAGKLLRGSPDVAAVDMPEAALDIDYADQIEGVIAKTDNGHE